MEGGRGLEGQGNGHRIFPEVAMSSKVAEVYSNVWNWVEFELGLGLKSEVRIWSGIQNEVRIEFQGANLRPISD